MGECNGEYAGRKPCSQPDWWCCRVLSSRWVTELFLGRFFVFLRRVLSFFRVRYGEGGRPMKSATCDPKDRPVWWLNGAKRGDGM